MKKKIVIYISFISLIVFSLQAGAQTTNGYSAYYELAIKVQKQKKYKEAEQIFSQGIKKYPNKPGLYFHRGKLKQEYLGNCTSAMNDFTMTIRLIEKFGGDNFMHAKSYYLRGLCLDKNGLYQEAMSDFTNSIRIKPNYSRVYLQRAKIFARVNDIKNVKINLQLAVKYNPKWSKTANSIWKKVLAGERDL